MTYLKSSYKVLFIASIIFSSLAIASSTLAAGWYLSDSGATTELHDTVTWSDTDGVAVGDDGTVVYLTNDAGENWSNAFSGTSSPLYAVDHAGGNTLYAVGDNGKIIRTTNGGLVWSSMASGTSQDLFGVAFSSITNGVAVGTGGAIIYTNDGLTFNTVATGTTNAFLDVYYAGGNTYYAVGINGGIYTSINKGSSWSAQTSGTTEDLHAIWCVDATSCLAGGENAALLITTDSGASWTVAENSGVSVADTILTIDGIDASNIMLGTLAGDMINTTDSGVAVETNSIGLISGSVNSISYFDTDTRFAVGVDEGSSHIWKYDTTAPSRPTGFAILEGNPSNTATPNFDWDESTDNSGSVANYVLNIDNGADFIITTSTEHEVTSALSQGDHVAKLSAYDQAGNESEIVVMNFIVDSVDPSVSPVVQTTATTGGTWFTATASDATTGIKSCDLVVNGFTVGQMEHAGGDSYTLFHGFGTAGTYSIFVACLDEANNATSSEVTNVQVSFAAAEEGGITEGIGVDTIETGTLVKTPCDFGADVNDPCKAVYWYGNDGMRHAFPNDKAYFTWFDDFDDVVLVTTDLLASMPIGANVTYRPNVRLIKFPSLNTVYRVGDFGELRAITTEEIAIYLYGNNWNQQVDDVSEAFYFNYSFGEDITEMSDFSSTDPQNPMSDPNDLF